MEKITKAALSVIFNNDFANSNISINSEFGDPIFPKNSERKDVALIEKSVTITDEAVKTYYAMCYFVWLEGSELKYRAIRATYDNENPHWIVREVSFEIDTIGDDDCFIEFKRRYKNSGDSTLGHGILTNFTRLKGGK